MTKIKVLGIGNTGSFFIGYLKGKNLQNVDLYVIDNKEQIDNNVNDEDIVFIIYDFDDPDLGLASVTAKTIKKSGALTIGIATSCPYLRKEKRKQDLSIIQELKSYVDTMITIPNDEGKKNDNLIYKTIKSILEVMDSNAIVPLYPVDIKWILKNSKIISVGTAVSSGKNRSIEAAKKAISDSLLAETFAGVRNVIVNITGGNNLTLFETEDAIEIVKEAANNDAYIILGVVKDDNLQDEVSVTIIAGV